MIQPKDFPYITSIYVNDCFTYQNFNIELAKHKPFSNLILTGKNGDGKSTILKNIDLIIQEAQNSISNYRIVTDLIDIHFSINQNTFFYDSRVKIIYSFLQPNRNSKVNTVESPGKQDIFEKIIYDNSNSSDFFIKNFKQFLVNKKVNQAFAQLENNIEEITKTELFFGNIEQVFSKIFEDKGLKLTFQKETYEFYITLSNGRKLTFDILPDGFSALLSILMDLFVRLDLIRKAVNDNSYNPCGIVLIDEPETHLHLSLQYQVLPILTTLFSNVQFIVATHSPAVISSIKNVTIFDLTSKETLSDEAVGKSFSELMVSHFGLDNEFSDITDALFDKANDIIKKNRNNPVQLNVEIKQFIKENELYISPAMRFELESKLSEI